MSLRQLLATLLGRKLLFAATLLTFVVVALVAYLVTPRTYTASATVVLDTRTPDPVVGIVLGHNPAYVATQQDIISSERVARLVIERLRLDNVPELRKQWTEATNASGDYLSWLATAIRSGLIVKPSRESNLIEVSYQARDPNFATAMANAFVQAYLQTVVELRVEPAKQYRKVFDEQAEQFRQRLETAQRKLSDYQQKHGLTETNARFDIETARLAELSNQLAMAQSVASDASSRRQTAGALSQEAMSNPVIASLRSELARQEATLKQLTSRLGDANPQVVQQRAGIAELKAKIDAEVGRVTGSLGNNTTTAQIREAQLRQQIDAQRARVLKVKQIRDEAQVLEREVESAQRAYDNVLARASQSTLESQASQANVSLLKPATVPFTHSSPSAIFNFGVSILLGLTSAITLVFGVEYFDRRLRTTEDLNGNLDNIPFIVEMPRMNYSQKGTFSSSSRLRIGKRSLPELPST